MICSHSKSNKSYFPGISCFHSVVGTFPFLFLRKFVHIQRWMKLWVMEPAIYIPVEQFSFPLPGGGVATKQLSYSYLNCWIHKSRVLLLWHKRNPLCHGPNHNTASEGEQIEAWGTDVFIATIVLLIQKLYVYL